MQDALIKLDPNFFAHNLTNDRMRDGCPDCKEKNARIKHFEDHNRTLTEYIKIHSSDRLTGDKQQKYE